MSKFKVTTKNGKSFSLDDKNEIHRGGEGRILVIPTKKERVAKIYHDNVIPITEKRFEQLQKLDASQFVKPLDLLYQKNKIIGFLMEYAGSEYFPIASLFNRSFCQRNAITAKYKKDLAEKLIEAVKQAHFNGFVIGDLNQYNVLVNLNGELKLIDVDGYETPGHKHTGVLLDEIRDYYYQGTVSMNSDYFALSVLLFYLMTYTHPFKGIHQKYKTLAERMVQQLPVFTKDPLLKAPKCYEALQDGAIQTKFDKLYYQGERFLFSLNGAKLQQTQKKAVLKTKHQEKDLIIKSVLQNVDIVNVYFNQLQGYIETNEKYIFYDARNKGYLTKKLELPKDKFDQVFMGEQNTIARKEKALYHIKKQKELIKLTNFEFPDNYFIYQLDNILLVVSSGQMFYLYLDDVLNNSIRNKRVEVFSEAMQHHNGLIQNTGGVQRIFYNTGKDIATTKTEKKVKQVFQRGNIGLVQYIKNNQVINRYFKLDGLKFELMKTKPEVFAEFGYLKTDKNNGFIFEPDDNQFNIRRTEDFKIVSELKCSKISKQSSLFCADAGIVVWEGEEVVLVNRR